MILLANRRTFLSPLMFDLLYLVIQSDTIRVFTAGFGMHHHVIQLDGVKGGYHGLTPHGKFADRFNNASGTMN
ncbi:MAG: hypothetical protein ACI8XO_003011 [Verrucomicrobiales bacterium]|jgi:hypothetical protein